MQIMENAGPEEVPTPREVVEAVANAEVIAIHFAPVSKAVLMLARTCKRWSSHALDLRT